MKTDESIELVITCNSWQAAQDVADQLLDQGMISSAEFFPVHTRSGWKHSVGEVDHVRVILQTAPHNTQSITDLLTTADFEGSVTLHKTHSAHVPVTGLWLEKVLNGNQA